MKKNINVFAFIFMTFILSSCGLFAPDRKIAEEKPLSPDAPDVSVDNYKEYFTFSVPEGWEKMLVFSDKSANKYQVGFWHDCAKASVSFVPDHTDKTDAMATFFAQEAAIKSVSDVKNNIHRFICKKCSGNTEDAIIDGSKAVRIDSSVGDSSTIEYIIPAKAGVYSLYYNSCDSKHGEMYRYVFDRMVKTFRGYKLDGK